jgi:hypothetical protein
MLVRSSLLTLANYLGQDSIRIYKALYNRLSPSDVAAWLQDKALPRRAKISFRMQTNTPSLRPLSCFSTHSLSEANTNLHNPMRMPCFIRSPQMLCSFGSPWLLCVFNTPRMLCSFQHVLNRETLWMQVLRGWKTAPRLAFWLMCARLCLPSPVLEPGVARDPTVF